MSPETQEVETGEELKTGTVCFTVTGEFVTQHARERVLEGLWSDAITFLTDSLEGLTHDQAIEICSGKKKLTGRNNDVDIVEEDEIVHKGMEEQLSWLYAGTVFLRAHNLYFRPYAYVSGWCEKDIYVPDINRWHPATRMPVLNNKKADWGNYRCVYYMDDRCNDRVQCVKFPDGAERMVLWRYVKQPPIWWKITQDWQVGINQYLEEHHEIEERGGHLLRIDPAETRLEAYERHKGISSEPTTDFMTQIAQEAGIEPDKIKGLVGAISGTTDFESKPVEDLEFKHRYGYVLPDGRFYGCEFHEHSALATRIWKYIVGQDEIGDPEVAADIAGWVRVMPMPDGKSPNIFSKNPMSERQKDAVMNWCLSHQFNPREVPDLVNDL